ncbi:MAG: hypothetical protein ACI9HK_001563 [Pirellulaceae bacterium]|jgi:hypothetical protein
MMLPVSTYVRSSYVAGNFVGVATDPVTRESKRNLVGGVITMRLSANRAIQFSYLFRKVNHENFIHQQ